jgi:hypothetical protein
MFDVLNKYLFQHKSISIPGLGSLVAETIPAITDFANKQLLPVRIKFRFDKYFDSPDREFFMYLAGHKNIADFEAIKWYNEFAYELRNKIRNDDGAKWEGVGTFKQEAGGDIVFEPFPSSYELYAPVSAERVIRTDARHSILVGDKEKTNYEMAELLSDDVHVEKESWWIYAIILAAIALIVLFFYFFRSDMKWGTMGNQQPVKTSQLTTQP